MADDMTEADAQIQAIQGLDNHPSGFVLIRLWRQFKLARTKLQDHEARISALEGK